MEAAQKKNTTASNYLDAAQWEKNLWWGLRKSGAKDRWVASSDITRKFLEHLLPLGMVEGEKKTFTASSRVFAKGYL